MRDFAKLQTSSWPRQFLGEITTALLLGLLLTWFGPFGTDERDFLPRMGYWIALAACWLAVTAVIGFILARSHRLAGLHPYYRRAFNLLISAIPMLVIVVPATRILSGWRPNIWEVFELYGAVIVLGGLISFAGDTITGVAAKLHISFRPEPAGVEVQEPRLSAHEHPGIPRLVKRLPPHLQSSLLCLSMEDHYVRVQTDAGSSLVLMKFSDAIDELDGMAGAQVHRSWWVAEHAVAEFVKRGRTANLRLTDGTIVPVSQPYRSIAAAIADIATVTQ